MTYLINNRLLAISFFYFTYMAISHAQVKFEDGYFIDETGQTVLCLIRNQDRQQNPTSFDYRLLPDSPIIRAELADVLEFGIKDVSQFLRATVAMDLVEVRLDKLDDQMEPKLEERTVFLRTLIAGAATLYEFNEEEHKIYFLQNANGKPEQLVQKKYRRDAAVLTNNLFRKQLATALECDFFREINLSQIAYDRKDLVGVFRGFNECVGADFVDYTAVAGSGSQYHLGLRPGLGLTAIAIDASAGRNVNFGEKITFRLGVEAELVLPFNQGKWSVLLEPTYVAYSNAGSRGTIRGEVDYAGLEVSVGVRYRIFLPKGQVFINTLMLLNWAVGDSRLDYETGLDFDLSTQPNFGIGLGYQLGKLSLEARYHTPRELLNDQVSISGNYNNIGLIAGYRLF